MRMTVTALAVSMTTLAAAQVSAQRPRPSAPPNQDRIVAYFLAGFGGDVRVRQSGATASTSADPGVGLGFRYEHLVNDSFSIAPLVEWLSFHARDLDERNHFFDFDVMFKFRKAVSIGSTTIEFSGAVPVGITVATSPFYDDAAIGFNTGALAGAAVFFKDKYGLFLESGWRAHAVWRNNRRGVLHQGVVHVGGALAF